MLLADLKEKKEELETSFLAAKEYVRINKARLIEEYNAKLEKKMEEKIQEFRGQISQRNI